MSVINRMLEDLERRHAADAPALATAARAGAPPPPPGPSAVRPRTAVLAVVLGGLALYALGALQPAALLGPPAPGESPPRQTGPETPPRPVPAPAVSPPPGEATAEASAAAVPGGLSLARTWSLSTAAFQEPAPKGTAPLGRPDPETLAALTATRNPAPAAPDPPVDRPAAPRPEWRVEKQRRLPTAGERADERVRQALEQGGAGSEDLLRSALALAPGHRRAATALAARLARRGQGAEAVGVLQGALEHNPGDPGLVRALARQYAAAGDNDGALALLEPLLEDPGASPRTWALAAAAHQGRGHHGEALAAFRQALRGSPGVARWWAGLGISLEAEGRKGQARQAYRRARDLGLDDPLAGFVGGRLTTLGEAP